MPRPRLLLLLMLVLGLALSGQAGAQLVGGLTGFCWQGGVSATTQGLPSTNKLQGIIPSCTVTVYLTGTQTLATLYADSSLTPLANPFTATNLASVAPGQWIFNAAQNAAYDIVLSGGIPPNTYHAPVTIKGLPIGLGGGGSSLPIDSVQFALANGAFGSDPNITIDPVLHSFKVAGSGTSQIYQCGGASGACVLHTVNPATSTWTQTDPVAAPTIAGSCYAADTTGTASWSPNCGTAVNAAAQPGSDIGAKINSALTACTSQCNIYVPPGAYTYSTRITLPLNANGTYGLTLDPGAVMTYSGSGDAIVAPIHTGLGSARLIIQGGQLLGGNSTAASAGIHIYPTNSVTVRNMLIQGFFGGDGVLIEGANAINIYDNEITQNLNGVHLVPTFCTLGTPAVCGSSVMGGGPFSPNAIHVQGNQITGSFHWAIFDETTVTGGGLSPALNNHYSDNNLENNGVSGSAFGAIYEQRSLGTVIGPGNYFEGSPRQVVLGIPSVGSGFESFGPQVWGNYFTTETTTPFNIEAQNTDHLQITGNSEMVQSSNSSNCFFNQFSGSAATNTYFGSNLVVEGVTVAGNTICTNGGASLTTGTGSFRIFPPNSLAQLVSSNFITTSSTTDTIPSINVIPSSFCFATPDDGTAAAATWGAWTVWVVPGTGSATLHHPATANVHLDIWCALEQPSS